MGGAPSQVLPGLWLGGQDVINDPKFFTERGIAFVLSLGPATPPPPVRRLLAGREHIAIGDVPTADLARHFQKIVLFIANGRHVHEGGVYVHCAAGIFRSTTSMCAYLMAHLDLTFAEALSFITSRRRAACPNEGFVKQLKHFEVSRERAQLAEDLRRLGPKYEEQRQRDLAEVRNALQQESQQGQPARPGAPPGAQRRSTSVGAAAGGRPQARRVEQQAQQHAMRAVREALASHQQHQQDGQLVPGQAQPPLRLGTGEAHGDVGLGWLLRAPAPGDAPVQVAAGAAPRAPPVGRALLGRVQRGAAQSQPPGERGGKLHTYAAHSGSAPAGTPAVTPGRR